MVEGEGRMVWGKGKEGKWGEGEGGVSVWGSGNRMDVYKAVKFFCSSEN